MKLAIFGGTFDPPHKGHSEIINAVSSEGLADRFIVLPSGTPPHKSGVSSMADRFEMARLAFGEKAEINAYEQNESLSYTAKTVKHFYEQTGEKNLLILGGDSVCGFTSWYRPDEIVRYADVAYFEREGVSCDNAVEEIKRIFGVQFRRLPEKITHVSSTRLRTDFIFGKDVSDRVEPCVMEYIKQKGLYGEYNGIIERLRGTLKPSRYEHTYRVVLKALEMNAKIRLDREKVVVACILHDCAKYLKAEDYGYIPPENMPDEVIHAFLGRIVAESDFGVTDGEILDAVKYHCTGRSNMTTLEKLVYVADYTEEGRGPFANEARNAFETGGINAAYEAAKRGTEKFLISQGKGVYRCEE